MAWASVLAAVIASAMMRVIAVASSLSQAIVGTPAGIKGVACIMVATKTLTYQDYGALPMALWLLVDRRVPIGVLRERVLAGVELALSRQ